MNLRLKTNFDDETKLNEMQNWLHLSSKAAVMRLALSVSIKTPGDPRNDDKNQILSYDLKKQNGSDYLRLTIFGTDEKIYKLLMINQLNREIEDDEFFPELTSFHISRGLRIIHSEYRYLNEKNKFLKYLLNFSNK